MMRTKFKANDVVVSTMSGDRAKVLEPLMDGWYQLKDSTGCWYQEHEETLVLVREEMEEPVDPI